MKQLVLKNKLFPCFDEVINIMLAFLTDKVPFFSHFSAIFQMYCFFDADQEKYAMSEVSIKNRIIWDPNSINMKILADEA